MPARKSSKTTTRTTSTRGARKSSTLSVEDILGVDPSVGTAGTAIRGIEYADDDRTESGKQAGTVLRVERLEPAELETTYRRSGLIFKGINQKARDAFKAGFELVPDDGDTSARRVMNLKVRDWMRSTKARPRFQQGIREGYWAGDGYVELVYPGGAMTPAPAALAPTRLVNVAPFKMRAVLDHRPGSETRGQVLWFVFGERVRDIPREQLQRWVEGGEQPREVESVLHPTRVAHFQPYPIAGDPDGYGMSVIEAAYISVISKTVGDRSMGDIMAWAGQGFFTLNVENATEDELKRAKKYIEASLKARKTYFVGSEKAKWETHEPVVPNVDPFYKQFYIEIAAALEMPTMILMGVQKGTVSGSSVDIIQYYDDVHAFQEDHVEPVLLPLLVGIVGRSDFHVSWTPLHVDKQTLADFTFKFGQTASGLVGAQILTKRQAVVMLKRALPHLDLPDPEDVPDEYVEKAEPSMVGDSPGDGAPGKRGDDEADD